jgi:hypothetical protein
MKIEDPLAVAESTILIEARLNRNAIYVLKTEGDRRLLIGTRPRADTVSERLTFLAALEVLKRRGLVSQISAEMYELTYWGWLESCALSGKRPEFAMKAVERARESLLIGALVVRGGILFIQGDCGTVVSAGGYSYNDNEEQRLLYVYVAETLQAEGFLSNEQGMFRELTPAGLTVAQNLSAQGIVQDIPKS